MEFKSHVAVIVDASGFSFLALCSISGISPCHGHTYTDSCSLSHLCAIPDYHKVLGDFAAFQVTKEHSFYTEELPIDVAFLSF
jgi:hypothetical protein